MKKFPITLYPTVTPNPNTIKFMADKYLLQPEEGYVDYRTLEEAQGNSKLAEKLFEQFPFITGVYIERNFISVSKDEAEMPWDYLTPEVRGFIHHHVVNGNEIVNLSSASKSENKVSFEASPLDIKIKSLMKQFVDEAVRGDGGKIEFESYKDGVVTVRLKGACVGCPARNKTLKKGIEDILKNHIPEIKEVIASNG